MILAIPNETEFISNFLNPISKINNTGTIKLSSTGISSLIATADGTLILYSLFNIKTDADTPLSLNLPDIGRLIKIISCIPSESFSLKIENNNLKFSSKEIRFTYHLLDDGIIAQCPIQIEKIKKLSYNTNFTLPQTSLVNIIRGSTFSNETNKIYFTTEDTTVYAELTDQQRSNVDSVKLEIALEFKGDPITTPLPLCYETIRILSGARSEAVKVHINTKLSVIAFEIESNTSKNLYISAGLTG